MQKLLVPLLVLSLTTGCKKTVEVSTDLPTDTLEFQYQKMPEKVQFDPETATLVEDWEEFMAFGNEMEVLYKATNNEDLILAVDELIKKEKVLETGTYPEIFNDFRVKSRQLVVRTYLYKLKASLAERQPSTEPTLEMLDAYNALRKQLNLIVRTRLDDKLLDIM